MHPLFKLGISIHAPREGSDQMPRRPQRLPQISIHAPREGSDTAPAAIREIPRDFNPRSP